MSLPYNCVRDNNIDHNLWREFFYPNQLIQAATINSDAASGYSTLTAGNGGTASPILLMQKAGRHFALRFATANAGVGLGAGSVSCVVRPWNMDNRHPCYIRVHWTSDDATAAVATWTVAVGTSTTGTAPATPTTGAMTRSAVSVAKSTTPQGWAVTRPGMLAPLATGPSAFHTVPPNTEALHFEVALATKSGVIVSTAFAWLNGIEVLYTPRATFGDGSGREGRYLPQPLQGGMESDPTNDFSR